MDSSSQLATTHHAQQGAPGEAAEQQAMSSQAAPASSRSRAGTKRHVGEHAARPAKRIRISHADDTAQAIAAIERLRRFRAEEAILKRDTG